MFSTKADAMPAQLEDRYEIIELVNRMVLGLDSKDWDGLEQLFTDKVYNDRTSLTGGSPETLDRTAFIGGWRGLMQNLDAIHHLVTGHVVKLDGDRAICTASMQGTHVFANPSGGSTWQVGGNHEYQLTKTSQGWRISGITFNIQWASGNQNVLALAMAAGSPA